MTEEGDLVERLETLSKHIIGSVEQRVAMREAAALIRALDEAAESVLRGSDGISLLRCLAIKELCDAAARHAARMKGSRP